MDDGEKFYEVVSRVQEYIDASPQCIANFLEIADWAIAGLN